MMMKYSLFGISYTATNYDEAANVIVEKGADRCSFGVSALAVHGLITAYHDPRLKAQVNQIDLVVPDGQPVRWALNSFYNTRLKDRVYGPQLTLKVLEKASKNKLKIYLYGSTQETCSRFADFIRREYPQLEIAGIHVDRFRDATDEEDRDDIRKINASGANIVLVGRGCPRQEVWVANHLGKVNAAMMAVGAAFDFHAGTVKQAPAWMQNAGLEWLFRLVQEPRRLWRRYLVTNSIFIYLFFKHKILGGIQT
jgi:N-acetylglucosaminyldiphosphoundecaprenol N-acetyl-beta-D-mannosaminyltransferase